MNALNPPGRRQTFAMTTIRNDPAAIAAAHVAYRDGVASARDFSIKGLAWTLVLQSLLPDWARKGDARPFGLRECTDRSLVIVAFTVNWIEGVDDEFVKTVMRQAVEQIDSFAAANVAGYRYRYLNYCAEWQKPFQSYGEENLRLLHRVSQRYSPGDFF